MPTPQGAGPGESPSLFVSLRSFWSVLLAIVYTRLDLATDEIEEQAAHVVKLLVSVVIAVIAFATAFFFANFFLIAIFWHSEYRLWVIGGVIAAYVLICIICGLIARNMIVNRPKILAQTIAELRKDVEGLTKTIAADKNGGAL